MMAPILEFMINHLYEAGAEGESKDVHPNVTLQSYCSVLARLFFQNFAGMAHLIKAMSVSKPNVRPILSFFVASV